MVGQQVVSETSSTYIAALRPSPSFRVPKVICSVLPRYADRSSEAVCQARALLGSTCEASSDHAAVGIQQQHILPITRKRIIGQDALSDGLRKRGAGSELTDTDNGGSSKADTTRSSRRHSLRQPVSSLSAWSMNSCTRPGERRCRCARCATGVGHAVAVARRMRRGRELPGHVRLEAAVDQPILALGAVVPDARVGRHVRGQSSQGICRDRQIGRVRIAGGRAQLLPRRSTVQAAIEPVIDAEVGGPLSAVKRVRSAA